MAAFAPRTHTLTGAVRAHFGLSVRDLARLLGCHAATVARDEAGTGTLPPGPDARLRALGAWLEAPAPAVPDPVSAAPPPAAAPDPVSAALRARLLVCWQALRRLARPLPAPRQAALRPGPAAHRRAAATAVPAALAQLAARYPLPPGQAALQAQHWDLLLREAEVVAQAPPDPAPALRAARQAGLVAEIAALEAALAGEVVKW